MHILKLCFFCPACFYQFSPIQQSGTVDVKAYCATFCCGHAAAATAAVIGVVIAATSATDATSITTTTSVVKALLDYSSCILQQK